MTKKSSKKNFEFKNIKSFLSYMALGIITIAIVFVGSLDKKNNTKSTIDLNAFATEEYKISTDQLSELYIVASLSNTLNLASADDTASNYVVTSSMYNIGQTSTSRLEKGNIIDTSKFTRGITIYTVQNGESMEDIASRFGLSTDQIRWSNGLKTTSISDGDTLYLPTTPGIVYTVKSGDTLDSIVEKYGSSIEEITILNDLETSDISDGMRIIIANGTLPEKERPEYVAPVVRSTYTYIGSTSERIGLTVIGWQWYGGGQCVGYALWYRNISGLSPLGPIPTSWGNANTWAIRAAQDGYRVDHIPEVGAIFQSSGGYYGHVGVVVGVNPDGSIVVQETNYNYVPGRVTQSTIPASSVGNLNYIH